ncbi:MAG: ribosomal L7Ae/L30e/S12e/Gadd45 family protein [Oscillospiraceae bacterium]|nr:ribosomal L7Ae/L30e/S12e/Gadd45 family protein [Oscillospiraceae bacterium]MBQ6902370.1 ribosomal L7Ae/L30e/S12e/Gadd45 family protein [Oscillospiraceae bacterium]
MKSNYLGLLGLAKRAGLLEAGDEAVRATLSAKKARVVLVASDASERTRSTFEFIAESVNVPIIPVEETREELGNALGRRPCATVCVCDVGLAASIVKKLSEHNEEARLALPAISARADKIAARRSRAKRKR